MDRHFVKALLFAWDRPEFRAGLRHLIDLDEVPGLLSALCVDEHDHEVERRAMDLLRSGLDTAEIRHATLLLVEDADIRDGHRSVTAPAGTRCLVGGRRRGPTRSRAGTRRGAWRPGVPGA